MALSQRLSAHVAAIRASGKTIYDEIGRTDPLWLPLKDLQAVLRDGLQGLSYPGLPLRTRSKKINQNICTALGFPTPVTFRKSQPRFPCLDFDKYSQKSNNLQIWNEEVDPLRRYVVVQLDERDAVTTVKVITGEALAELDTTGTLTSKYQARVSLGASPSELVTPSDTAELSRCISANPVIDIRAIPTHDAEAGALLPIKEILRRTAPLLGKSFIDRGSDQERNRGSDLHRLVAKALGYSTYADSGQFPDVPHQLLEIKLQTAATVDLGLVTPDSKNPLDVSPICGFHARHCDVRYLVFCGAIDGSRVTLTHQILTTGEGFFTRFVQFRGKVVNRKLQIPLPRTFFDDDD
jgi:hypothetical protein